MLQRAKCFGSRLSEVENFIEELFEDDMHAKRVESLAVRPRLSDRYIARAIRINIGIFTQRTTVDNSPGSAI